MADDPAESWCADTQPCSPSSAQFDLWPALLPVQPNSCRPRSHARRWPPLLQVERKMREKLVQQVLERRSSADSAS